MSDTATSTPATAIDIDYAIDAAPSTVWRVLTESDLITSWLMENDFRPVVGHRFTMRAKPQPGWDGIIHCEVIDVDEPKRLSYAWRGGTGENALDTVVTWTLEPTATGGTTLHLEHAGFTPNDQSAYEGLNRGWSGVVGDRLRVAAESLR